MEFQHKSILLNECMEGLFIKEDGIYVDGTLGGGGHSFHILERLGERGRLIGIDQDEDATKAATKSTTPYTALAGKTVRVSPYMVRWGGLWHTSLATRTGTPP